MAGLFSTLSPGANGVVDAAGVVVSEAIRSLGVAQSLPYMAVTVGDRLVNGWC
jgi:hypothetical protein